jgi:hypothetical protein
MPNFKKYFTPAEASKTLPLVKSIVSDILAQATLLRQSDESVAIDSQQLRENIEANLAELEEIGCFYKDWSFTLGLVDFPAQLGDRDVFLCWRSDENELLYFHEVEAGYAGRQLISSHFRNT